MKGHVCSYTIVACVYRIRLYVVVTFGEDKVVRHLLHCQKKKHKKFRHSHVRYPERMYDGGVHLVPVVKYVRYDSSMTVGTLCGLLDTCSKLSEDRKIKVLQILIVGHALILSYVLVVFSNGLLSPTIFPQNCVQLRRGRTLEVASELLFQIEILNGAFR